ncbi:hypothetical protein BUALT_Bualt02G0217200 [Buddleja alternifolia]|uniref:FLZ-type domain-containing protein n=1 Tax=Buddleja alternifolia TaxID=168488 RepID=A0AAV6Y283_9LAMI|nr:hypothetical protein BUALT_Bualt02G0217200 [Buddleja alternifolia]
MTVKRSRPGSSSSHLETANSTNAAASVTPVKFMKTDDAAEPSRPKILTFASPVSVAESDQQKIGGFLERCHYCNKRIAQNSEFIESLDILTLEIYSTLCAFCSAECRDLQIAVDQSARKPPENRK